jgi:Tol biopolymer transport system component
VDLRQPTFRPRSLYSTKGSFVAPIDWAPDGQSIAVYIQRREDRLLQLGLLRVSDGALQVLQSVAWAGTLEGFFAPGGRDLAYSQPIEEDLGARDVFLMDVGNRRRTPIVANPADDFPLGWTPDGRHLLFASNRSGTVGVWAQAVIDRKPAGPPTLVHSNIGGDVQAVGVSRSGALLVGVRTFSQDVEVASLDPASGRATGGPVEIRSTADRTWLPAWSADGRVLAYVLVRNGSENTVGIRSVETGEERELRLGSSLDRVRSLAWTPYGRSLVGWGRDLRGRYGIFRIETTSGHVTPIVFRDPPPVRQFIWSPDGETLRYGGQGGFFEHDGQAERQIDLLKGVPGLPSPDGRWIARLIGPDRAARSGTLVIHSTGDGESRELHRFDAPDRLADMRWARDGRTLVVVYGREGQPPEVLMLPIDGAARTLDIDVNRISKSLMFVELSPDRRSVAYITGDDRAEVWALENFLPVQ